MLDKSGTFAIPDFRRHVAFKAYGLARITVGVQAAIDDAEGFVETGEYLSAVISVRRAILQCLSIMSLEVAGELMAGSGDVTFNPFEGLSPKLVQEALGLIYEGIRVSNSQEANAWLDKAKGFVAETENRLGFAEGIPIIRSPSGMFPALRLARELIPVVDDLGLPPFIPESWVKAKR